jgi:hypothetical protein
MHTPTEKAYTDRSHFTPGLRFQKVSCKLNIKFPFKTMYFLWVRGLTTSSHIAYSHSNIVYSGGKNQAASNIISPDPGHASCVAKVKIKSSMSLE